MAGYGILTCAGKTTSSNSSMPPVGVAEPESIGTLLTVQTCAGFLLTTVSIQLVPAVVTKFGWQGGFGMLALGPALGCIAMHPSAGNHRPSNSPAASDSVLKACVSRGALQLPCPTRAASRH
ncbi:MFS transporter [Pandoraea thiooxydans]|nr:MFS transporter [Pandoraea thiooxydans]